MSQREQELAVSTADIIDHAVHLCPAFKNGNESYLKSWVYKFMKRYNLTSRRITRKSQILNATMDQVKQDFCKRVMHILHNRII